MKILIAGCGFLGETAAGFFCAGGAEVMGLCASEETASRFVGSPFPVVARDISNPLQLPAGWDSPDVLIHCASSGRGGLPAYEAVYLRGMENLLQACQPGHVIFAGSTSVYAQTSGEWVNEDSAAEPRVPTGLVLRETEQLTLSRGGAVIRLSGLYGPGRSVLLRKFLDGSAVLEEGGGRWINQIHRDDAARALVHAAKNTIHGIFNASDDQPATQREVYSWISEALGRPLPPIGPAPAERKRGVTNKRVSNARLKATGWQPAFPAYKDALPFLLRHVSENLQPEAGR